ncbi:hypothetical protein JK159_02315 [Weissella minor]|uniref:hypothetical protein n=1 Tax=Weissella minor TaxID=1620 RepID=UPI001BAF07BA|nr:hypothetical protein [Weissella minor]MBS0949217.1 hypothetical protein [Weissella minor]
MAFEGTKPKQKIFKSNPLQDVQLRRPVKGLLDFLQWKGFVGDDDILVLTDNKGKTVGYLDMVTILGKDLDFVYGQGSDGASQIIRDYNSFLRSYLMDFDILITQMPADTQDQQSSWAFELAKLENELRHYEKGSRAYDQGLIRRKELKRQLGRARFVQNNIEHEAYTAFIYGETEKETRRLREQFKHTGGSALDTRKMEREQKEYILAVLQDPTRQLKGGTDE